MVGFLGCFLVKVVKPKPLLYCEIYYTPVDMGKHILLFALILCHICIHENRIIDQEAQDSLDTPISNSIIPCTNFKPLL